MVLVASVLAEVPKKDENVIQTIEGPNGIQFTWKTELLDGEPYIFGNITINQTDQLNNKTVTPWADMKTNVGQDKSLRICLQYYLKENDALSVGQKTSKRARVRFFNKKLNEYTFWPQVGEPHLKDDGGFIINPDYADGKDDIQKWCASQFQPLNATTSKKTYVEAGDDSIETDELGWAVESQTIQRHVNKAMI